MVVPGVKRDDGDLVKYARDWIMAYELSKDKRQTQVWKDWKMHTD